MVPDWHAWRVGAWSGREKNWDEEFPRIVGQTPCQISQVRRQQYGPFLVVTSRRAPLGPGETCD